MVNFLAFAREHWMHLILPASIATGWYLDKLQDRKLTAFRNKSRLFQRELKPGEMVTWE